MAKQQMQAVMVTGLNVAWTKEPIGCVISFEFRTPEQVNQRLPPLFLDRETCDALARGLLEKLAEMPKQ